MKKILFKDILNSIRDSKGRFLSIFFLILLGTFAYVGLKAAGPDMRRTADSFSQKMNVADENIISTWGLNKSDQKKINSTDDVKNVEYGYFQDNEIADTTKSLRLFSKPQKISQYNIESGRLPRNNREIALDYSQKKSYSLGNKIKFNKVKEDNILKQNKYTIVGFVKSSENTDATDLGSSTTGTGTLDGYGVLTADSFKSKLFTIARMTFKDTASLNKTSQLYKNRLKKHEKEIKSTMKVQAKERLTVTKKKQQKKIDDGWRKIAKAQNQLTSSKNQLIKASSDISKGKKEIEENQDELNSAVSKGQEKLNSGIQQIASGKEEIKSAREELAEAQAQLSQGKDELQSDWQKLLSAKQELVSGKETLDESQKDLVDANKEIQEFENELLTATKQLNTATKSLDEKQQQFDQAQAEITNQKNVLKNSQNQITTSQNEINKESSALENEKSKYSSDVRESTQELSNDSAALNEAKNNLSKTNDEVTDLSQQLQDDKTKQSSTTIEQLQKNLQAEENTQKDIKTKITVPQQENTKDQSKADVAKKEYQSFIENKYTPSMSVIEKKQTELTAMQTQLNQSKEKLDSYQATLDNEQKEINSGQQELIQEKNTLDQSQNLLTEKNQEYQNGLKQYIEGKRSYNSNLLDYFNGLNEWMVGFETLKNGSKEYLENLESYKKGNSELKQSEAELAEGKQTLFQEKEKNQQKIDAANVELMNSEKEYQADLAEFNKQEEKANKKINKNKRKLTKSQKTLTNLQAPVYSVENHEEMDSGYKSFVDSSSRIDILSNIFPVFLFAVAALVSLTTMTRFVEEERLNIGIYKALGYSNGDVKKKFIIYGLASSILGTIAGSILGHTLLPKVIYDVYADGTSFPEVDLAFYPGYTIIGLTVAILCTVVSTYVVISKNLNENPAELLLPKPPKEGSRILLERISPLWKRMSFNYKITARNLFRYKKRMFMTIFGVAGCMALLITAFGIKDSISGITERQSQQILKYDLLVSKENRLNNRQEKSINSLMNNKNIKSSANIFYQELTSTAATDGSTQSITSIVTDDSKKFDHYISLKDANSFKSLPLTNKGIVISKKLAKIMNVKVGQKIKLRNEKNQIFKATVSGITEMYLGHFAFMNGKAYQHIFHKRYHPNSSLVKLKSNSKASKNAMSALFMKNNGIDGVVQSNDSEDGSIAGLTQITLILVIGASLLALIVIYTLSNINVSERIRELSTIKVLGFYDNEVTMYIYRETIILSILGILVGMLAGAKLSEFITSLLPTDEVLFDTTVRWTNFGISTLITMGITIGLMFIVHFKIKKIDMLDALKSVD